MIKTVKCPFCDNKMTGTEDDVVKAGWSLYTLYWDNSTNQYKDDQRTTCPECLKEYFENKDGEYYRKLPKGQE